MSVGRASLIALVLVVVALSTRRETYPGPNLYGVQAQAWLDGHLDVAGPLEDLSLREGRWYVPFPPLPSLIVLPAVALVGHQQTPYRTMAFVLALLAAWVASRILARLDCPRSSWPWLLGALLLGTAFWHCTIASESVWFFAHVVATLMALLALHEAVGPARGALLGLWVGLAFLSRQMFVYLVPFLAVALWLKHTSQGRRQQLLQLGALLTVASLCIGLSLGLNAARFGDPFDSGYGSMPLIDHLGARVSKYGLFHLAYVPFNFIHMFLQGPHVMFGGPRLLVPQGMDGMGTSLTIASPFLAIALAARERRAWLVAAWASVSLALVHILLYYNNGWVQLNAQRFSLDFVPLLWVLFVLGTRRVRATVWRPLVAWSVGLNAFAMVGLPELARALGKL